MPHGVLLFGPPGTGKTLLARAVAGEAHAAFFSIAASEFIEAIVGVGASRVRDLFAKAKEAAPSIIFIDELDAIGRSRQGSAGITGANDEREQTLDQILTEMDGFECNEAVVVLGATNRPEILDPALLRPGRFDRRVAVSAPRPRRPARRSSRSTPARCRSPTTSTSACSPARRPGWSAPISPTSPTRPRCWRRAAATTRCTMADFTDSLEKILLGAPRGIVLSPEDRERTAYHESGHALVGMLTPDADPVRKVSIIPRGMALGVTLSTPDADRVSYSREELEAKIRVALGGRVAEEVVYGKITTGAESDIQQLTHIARQMVGRWGMSEKLGPVAVLPSDGSSPFLPGASEVSQQTQWLVDEEVRRLIEDAHAEVTQLLTDHREPARQPQPRAARRPRRSTRSTPTPPPASRCEPPSSRRPAARTGSEGSGPSVRHPDPEPGAVVLAGCDHVQTVVAVERVGRRRSSARSRCSRCPTARTPGQTRIRAGTRLRPTSRQWTPRTGHGW